MKKYIALALVALGMLTMTACHHHHRPYDDGYHRRDRDHDHHDRRDGDYDRREHRR